MQCEVTPAVNKLYRRVFSTGDGKLVLADLLNMCGYFGTNETNPLGKAILAKLGALAPVNTPAFLEAIVSLPELPTKEED